MSDSVETEGSGDVRTELADELGRSLGAIWLRHAGARPSSVSVEMSGNVVRCVMEGAVSAIDSEPVAGDDGGPVVRSPDSAGYRNEATAAVRRITHRRVRGFVPKRDGKSDVATDTYILEPIYHAP